MILGTLKRKKKVDGFLRNNCLEMRSIYQRHEDLATEMLARGYNHKSPMEESEFGCIYDYPQEQIYTRINRDASLQELITRCDKCAKLYNEKHGTAEV